MADTEPDGELVAAYAAACRQLAATVAKRVPEPDAAGLAGTFLLAPEVPHLTVPEAAAVQQLLNTGEAAGLGCHGALAGAWQVALELALADSASNLARLAALANQGMVPTLDLDHLHAEHHAPGDHAADVLAWRVLAYTIAGDTKMVRDLWQAAEPPEAIVASVILLAVATREVMVGQGRWREAGERQAGKG